MKERPILFNGPMVRALLADRKTQTRRIVKPQPDAEAALGFLIPRPNAPGSCAHFHDVDDRGVHSKELTVHCPYGQPGDRLWVRETWQYYDWTEEGEPCIRFHADNATTWPEPGTDEWSGKLVDVWEALSREDNFNIDNRARDRKWRPSIHMPRWASRITLEIVSVRVERLQDISEADALSEGVSFNFPVKPSRAERMGRDAFCALWESINGSGSWEANPWLWVVEFRRLP